jgi:hypothetical protein
VSIEAKPGESHSAAGVLTSVPAPLELSSKKAFGVDYSHIKTSDGGDLWLTGYGRPLEKFLVPEAWHTDGWYYKGSNAGSSTGSSRTYLVNTREVDGVSRRLVVRWSRFGEAIPGIENMSERPDVMERYGVTYADINTAKFNNPFQEFGLVLQLRDSSKRDGSRILTQKPLAIYSPPPRKQQSQQRQDSLVRFHQDIMDKDQSGVLEGERIRLENDRTYALLYERIEGENAVKALRALGYNDEGIMQLWSDVAKDLGERGFVIIDGKPDNLIVRVGVDSAGTRTLLRRNDKIVTGIIDYELLARRQPKE